MLRLLNGMLTTLVVLMLATAGSIYYVNVSLDAAGPLEQNRIVAIPRNDGSLAIAERLEREGVVTSRHLFLMAYWLVARQAAWANAKPVQLKAGEYEIKPQASLRNVIDALSEGRTVLMRITIPEGLTSFQIVERLKADQGLTGELREVPPEGSLLPETYSVPRGSARTAVIE
ncbi:MAG: endolytic transglycosylase MltG, partial [Hyphomicrobiales bacterium]|nr:endolytic transglycosylase MltG [Hyphomicrobiales bacterium]